MSKQQQRIHLFILAFQVNQKLMSLIIVTLSCFISQTIFWSTKFFIRFAPKCSNLVLYIHSDERARDTRFAMCGNRIWSQKNMTQTSFLGINSAHENQYSDVAIIETIQQRHKKCDKKTVFKTRNFRDKNCNMPFLCSCAIRKHRNTLCEHAQQ